VSGLPGVSILSDHGALTQALQKLIDIVSSENDILSRHEAVSHSDFADRKNHALRELMAVQRGHQASTLPDTALLLVRELSNLLQENSRLLKLHISAVGEVNDIIIGTLREAESDGTYFKPGSHWKT
jgi:hypothetical protein